MAETDAIIGYGTTLADTTGAIFEIKTLSGPNVTRGSIDVTHMDSPDDHEEFIAALANGGEVTFTCNFKPSDASHQRMLTNITGATEAWTITLPDAGDATITFNAFITGWNPGQTPEGELTLEITLKVTGKVTLTP